MFHPTAYDPHTEHSPEGGGLACHRRHIKDIPGVLDVVAVVANPRRYRSRYDLYRAFERHMACSGVRLTTVECAFGRRPWEVTEPGNARHLQVRTDHELWHKENLINLGIKTLPRDWQYVAWIDADIAFQRPDWVQETLQALQHYAVVQPFSHSLNMSAQYHPIFDSIHGGTDARKIVASWLYCHVNGIPKGGARKLKGLRDSDYTIFDGNHVWHSGFAWAARREAIDAMGGLLDWAILGSADRHMADMMIGHDDWNPKLSPGYRAMLDIYKVGVDALDGNFGYVDGLVTHHWHGKLVNRRYCDRWKILFKHQFDPVRDLRRDWQGLWKLAGNKPGLRDDVREYFRSRDEDAPA